MSNIYVRIRHYIANYLRNLDDLHPLPKDKPIQIEHGDVLTDIIRRHIYINRTGHVDVDCLSENQMMALRQGKVLFCGRNDFQMDIQRDRRRPLTMAEILTLCGKADQVRYDSTGAVLPDTAYNDEYVAFRLPQTMVIDGREQRITGDYMLLSTTEFVAELRRRFGCALSAFVSHQLRTTRNVEIDQFVFDDTPVKQRLRHHRAKMEALDRFMLRYQLRDDDLTRESLKKLMNRDIMSSVSHYNNDIDLARWDSDNPPCVIERDRTNLKRPVICLETGIVFNSIAEAAAHHQISYMTLWTALSRKSTCFNLHFEYYDPTQPKSPTSL